MSQPVIKAVWAKDLNTCTVTIADGIDSHTYHNLRTKKQNLRDREDPQVVYTVKIPCRAALGQDYMLCCGHDTIYNYKHPEWQELIFTPLGDDDEIMDIPQRKKGKKHAEYQLSLFSAKEDKQS